MERIINDIYRITGNGSKITVSVTIGYRQDADVKISIDNNLIHDGTGSVIKELGLDTELNLKDLKVEAYAQDIQTDFDLVTMTLTIDGGKETKSYTVGTKSKDGEAYYLKVGNTFID